MTRSVCVLVVLVSYTSLSWCQVPGLDQLVKKYQDAKNTDHVSYAQEARAVYERLRNVKPESFIAKLKALQKNDVPDQCYNDAMTAVMGLQQGNLNSLYMLDAAGKPPPGILLGLFNWMGSYAECTNITYPTSNVTGFQGRYCNMQVGAPGKTTPGQLPKSVTVGICIPSSCSVYEVELFINYYLDIANVTKAVRTFGGWCQPLDSEVGSLEWGAILMIVILSIIGCFLVAGTLYDVFYYQSREKQANELESLGGGGGGGGGGDASAIQGPAVVDLHSHDVDVGVYAPLTNQSQLLAPRRQESVRAEIARNLLLAFSVPRNLGKLLRVPPQSDIAAIHGIRFLSMTWVILGHTFAFIINNTANPVYATTLINRWTFQAILNATVSVDTFFLLSGTLVAYLTLKEMEKRGSANLGLGWIMFYVHRYWRLTAPYMLVVGMWSTLYRYTGSGANWPPGNTMAGGCNETWWLNALYLSNLVNTDKMCMGWSWYLSNDMQFYWISPLFLVALYCMSPSSGERRWLWGVVAGVLVLGTTLACLIVRGLFSIQFNMGIGFLGSEGTDWFAKMYIKPWARIGPYMVGIMLGWALWKSKLQYRMNWVASALGWMCATAVALALTYGPYSQVHGPTVSVHVAALYNSVERTVWGLCVAWVLFACCNGSGGLVNRLLSWPALVPLSRLTYMAYLVHPAIIFNYYLTRPAPIYVDDLQIIYLFLGHLVLSYMVALVVSVALESPLMGIERALRRKDKTQ